MKVSLMVYVISQRANPCRGLSLWIFGYQSLLSLGNHPDSLLENLTLITFPGKMIY